MFEGIMNYLLLGTIWCFICDRFMVRMQDNWTRVRFIVFWPYTLFSFLYAIYLENKDD